MSLWFLSQIIWEPRRIPAVSVFNNLNSYIITLERDTCKPLNLCYFSSKIALSPCRYFIWCSYHKILPKTCDHKLCREGGESGKLSLLSPSAWSFLVVFLQSYACEVDDNATQTKLVLRSVPYTTRKVWQKAKQLNESKQVTVTKYLAIVLSERIKLAKSVERKFLQHGISWCGSWCDFDDSPNANSSLSELEATRKTYNWSNAP